MTLNGGGKQLSTAQDLAIEAVKASPPITVAGTSFFGAVSWSDFAYMLTAVYTAFLLFFLLRDRWWRDRKSRKKSRK